MRSFYKVAFIALGAIIALFAVAAPLYAQTPTPRSEFPPPTDVVEYDSDTKRHYFTSGVGLEVIILTRAEIYVTAAEDGPAKQSIYGNSLSYKQALEGEAEGRGTIFRNSNLADGRFMYKHDAGVGEDANAYESQILHLNTNALDKDAKGDMGSLPFTKRVDTANFFDKYMKDAEIRLKLSDASLPDNVKNCGGERTFRDSRRSLTTKGDTVVWECAGGVGDRSSVSGINIRSSQVKQVENFNVVYKYDGANTLEYVSNDGGNTKDFTFCDTTKGTDANRDIIPAFVRGRNCASSEYIDVEPADLAGRSDIYELTIKDTASNATVEVGVIPADHPSQKPAEQVNEAIAGLAANADNLENCKAGDGIDGSIGWILCPIVSVILGAVHTAETYIIKMLVVNPLEAVDGNPIFDLWKTIRNLSNILLIIAFLVLIYSQVTSFGPGLDAYQVKKLAPRLLLATIGIQLSFYLAAFLIDIFNILGEGIGSMVAAVLAQQPDATLVTVDGIATPVILLVGTGALLLRSRIFGGLGLGIPAASIAGFLFMALLVAAGAFITILVRQMLIIILVIISPVAIVSALLPGTLNVYKKWLSIFVKVLMMYPLIVLLFASGKLFGVIAGTGGVTARDSFISFFANIIPLIFIPFSFRVAGGLLARIGDFASKRGEGLRRATTDRQNAFLQGLNDTDAERALMRRRERDVWGADGYRPRTERGREWLRRKKEGRFGGAYSAYEKARQRAAQPGFGLSRSARIAQLRRYVGSQKDAREEFGDLFTSPHSYEASAEFIKYQHLGKEEVEKAAKNLKRGLNADGETSKEDPAYLWQVGRNLESMAEAHSDPMMVEAAAMHAASAAKLGGFEEHNRFLNNLAKGFMYEEKAANGDSLGWKFNNAEDHRRYNRILQSVSKAGGPGMMPAGKLGVVAYDDKAAPYNLEKGSGVIDWASHTKNIYGTNEEQRTNEGLLDGIGDADIYAVGRWNNNAMGMIGRAIEADARTGVTAGDDETTAVRWSSLLQGLNTKSARKMAKHIESALGPENSDAHKNALKELGPEAVQLMRREVKPGKRFGDILREGVIRGRTYAPPGSEPEDQARPPEPEPGP